MYIIIIIIFIVLFIFNIFNIEKSIKFINEFENFEAFDPNRLKKKNSRFLILFSLRENLQAESATLIKFFKKNNKHKDIDESIKIVCNPEYFEKRENVEFFIKNNINAFPSIAIFQDGKKIQSIELSNIKRGK